MCIIFRCPKLFSELWSDDLKSGTFGINEDIKKDISSIFHALYQDEPVSRLSLTIDRVLEVLSRRVPVNENPNLVLIKVFTTSQERDPDCFLRCLPIGDTNVAEGNCGGVSDVSCNGNKTQEEQEVERKFALGVGVLATDLLFMYQSGTYVDVKLVAGRETFYAHK